MTIKDTERVNEEVSERPDDVPGGVIETAADELDGGTKRAPYGKDDTRPPDSNRTYEPAPYGLDRSTLAPEDIEPPADAPADESDGESGRESGEKDLEEAAAAADEAPVEDDTGDDEAGAAEAEQDSAEDVETAAADVERGGDDEDAAEAVSATDAEGGAEDTERDEAACEATAEDAAAMTGEAEAAPPEASAPQAASSVPAEDLGENSEADAPAQPACEPSDDAAAKVAETSPGDRVRMAFNERLASPFPRPASSHAARTRKAAGAAAQSKSATPPRTPNAVGTAAAGSPAWSPVARKAVDQMLKTSASSRALPPPAPARGTIASWAPHAALGVAGMMMIGFVAASFVDVPQIPDIEMPPLKAASLTVGAQGQTSASTLAGSGGKGGADVDAALRAVSAEAMRPTSIETAILADPKKLKPLSPPAAVSPGMAPPPASVAAANLPELPTAGSAVIAAAPDPLFAPRQPARMSVVAKRPSPGPAATAAAMNGPVLPAPPGIGLANKPVTVSAVAAVSGVARSNIVSGQPAAVAPPASAIARPKAVAGVDSVTPEQPGIEMAEAKPDDTPVQPPLEAKVPDGTGPSARVVSAAQSLPHAGAAAQLMARGDELMSQGDIASARLVYRLAVDKGSAAAAFKLGRSFDPELVSAESLGGIRPDLARAIDWYRRAAAAGHVAAADRAVILEDKSKR